MEGWTREEVLNEGLQRLASWYYHPEGCNFARWHLDAREFILIAAEGDDEQLALFVQEVE